MQLPGLPAFDFQLTQELIQAWQNRGPSYRARTHHFTADGAPKFINRLIREDSPYLLQHAHNPVSWYPWGDEAFEEARRRDVPVLLSVGYSTCHWCHVMERESFEDLEIAAQLNRDFVAIKVDREERPDIDGIYMTAVQMLTGHGGWPMTVVMTPDRVPFFGGTYFPPRDGSRGARMGFSTLLDRLSRAHQDDRATVMRAASDLGRALIEATTPRAGAGVPGESVVLEAARALARRFDPIHGGFGSAPKFPRPVILTLLLRYGRRARDAGATSMVRESLAKMAAGGVNDQIGGGFHRYSTDSQWLVPHFEKMTYDNAQLAAALVEGWQATADPALRDAAERTLDYVEREMTSAEGAFYSATDADSEGHEGLFFSWTDAELSAALDAEEERVARTYFGVKAGGNFEGRHVLHRPRTDEAVAGSLGMTIEALREAVENARRKLYAARAKKIPPLLDDKIITEWNGQMISAFARAGHAFGSASRIEVAKRAARHLLDHARDAATGRLSRTITAGRPRHPGVLEDHAALVCALLDLLEATGEVEWLDAELSVQDTQDRYYLDPENGGYFTAASDVTDVLVRDKPDHDGATPSGNSTSVLNLLRLAELTGDERFRQRAEQTVMALASSLDRGAVAAPLMAAAVDQLHDAPPLVWLVLPAGASATDDPLVRLAGETYLGGGMAIAVREGEALEALARRAPVLAGKVARNGRTTAYVCRRGVCLEPATDATKLAAQLDQVEPYASPPVPLVVPSR